MSNDKPYERGLDKDNPLHLADDALCLSDYSMMFLSNHRQRDKIPKRVGHVKDICGSTRRLFVKVWVSGDNVLSQYWADEVTGTLYTESGECLSSPKRQITKWVRYRKDEWEKRKRVVHGELNVEWNEGI